MRNRSVTNISGQTLVCLFLYLLLYGGYIKLLFPLLSTGVLLLQAAAGFLLVGVRLRFGPAIRFGRRTLYMAGLLLLFFGVAFFNTSPNTRAELVTAKRIELLHLLLLCVALLVGVTGLDTALLQKQFAHRAANISLTLLVVFMLINWRMVVEVFTLGQRIGVSGSSQDSNPIWIGRLCADSALLLLFANNWRLNRLATRAKLAVLAFIMFCGGSKGPIVALGIAVLYYCFCMRGAGRGMTLSQSMALVLLAAAVPVGWRVLNSTQNSFIRQRFSLLSVLVDAPGRRLHMYGYTIDRILASPLLGYGLASWGPLYWMQFSVTATNSQYVVYPHNLYLETWFESGILTVVFLGILVWYAHRRYRAHRTDPGMQLVWCLFFVNALYACFSGSVFSGNNGLYYWLLLCTVVRPSSAARRPLPLTVPTAPVPGQKHTASL